MTKRIDRINLLRYAFMAWPLAFMGLPLYIYVPDFYMRSQHLSFGMIALILFSVRGLDAFIDPFLGMLSDRLSKRRLSVITAGSFILIAGVNALMNPPAHYTAAWFAVSLAAATFSFSLLTINLQSLGSLWSTDEQDRVRINIWREGFGIVGLVTGAIIPSLLMARYPADHSLSLFGIFQSVMLMLGLVGLCAWSRAADMPLVQSGNQKPAWRWSSFQNGYARFFITYGLSMLASAIPAVLVLSFIRGYVSDTSAWAGIFLFIYFISALIALPVWQRLSHSFGKFNLWLCAMALATGSLSLCLLMPKGDTTFYAIICFLSGIALSAELALPPGILSDMLHHGSDQERTSTYFSIMVFITKATLALGSAFIFLVLDINDLQPTSSIPPSLLVFLYAGLPCLIKAVAIFAGLRFQRLTPGAHHVSL